MAGESHEEVEARVRARKADKEHFAGAGIRTVVVTRKNLAQFREDILELNREMFRETHPPMNKGWINKQAEDLLRDYLLDMRGNVVLAFQGNKPVGSYFLSGNRKIPILYQVFVSPEFRNRRISELITAKAHYLVTGLYGEYNRTGSLDSRASQGRKKFHDRLQSVGGLAAMRPASGTPAVVRHRDELLAMKPSRRAIQLSRITARLRREGKTLDALHLAESLPPSRRRIRRA